MIRLKTKEEIKIIREGGKILARILNDVINDVGPGANTESLEKKACALIEEVGGRPAFQYYKMPDGEEFPSALCISINNEIVHAPAVPGRELKEGDIVGIDIGMEYPLNQSGKSLRNKYSKLGGFYTDMSKTVIVGKASSEVKKLVQTTKECLDLAIREVKPGNFLSDIGRVVQKHAEVNGFSVVRELVGHGVGYDVHEDPQVPNYEIKKGDTIKDIELKPGLVIAIEPMVNVGHWKIKVGDDNMSILTEDGSLSAHFEHTVAVTEEGCEVLTLI